MQIFFFEKAFVFLEEEKKLQIENSGFVKTCDEHSLQDFDPQILGCNHLQFL